MNLSQPLLVLAMMAPSHGPMKDYLSSRQNISTGVTSVGNGGGFGEMQALRINLQMQDWVRPCLSSQNPCALDPSELEQVQTAAQKSFHLRLSAECKEQPVTQIGSNEATLSTCAFYRKESPTLAAEVREFKEIGAWVLTSRLMSKSLELEAAYELAMKVFSSTEQTQEDQLMSLEEGQALVHLLTVKSSQGSEQSLSIEGLQKTVDLTPLLISTLGCERPQLKIGSPDTQVLGADQGYIESQVQWTCQGHRFSGKWQVFFAMQSQEAVVTSLQSRVVDRNQLQLFGP